ncbi:MAG: hypothetical protein VX874_00130 [Pseudomonadota bacterium]|nr:hypothetical protein [Pseudomonadota bacterium]
MGIVLVLLGLLPLMFLGDLFTGGSDDASDDVEDEADETAPVSFAPLMSEDTDEGEQVPLKPVTEDPTPYAGAEVDPATVLTPNVDDDTPFIGDDIDPETVIDPVDAPGEDYVPGSGISLQYLIERDSDLRMGLGWLDDHPIETVDDLRGDESSLVVMAETGAGEGTLDDMDGTPPLDSAGDIRLVDGAGGQ